MDKNLYIHTIGCQMNVYDSERIAKGLKVLGYNSTSSLKSANLIIVNTCAIRAKAEQKVFSFLGRLAQLKQQDPNLIIGVGGCVAQQEGRNIIRRVPQVDFVFGTHTIERLPDIVAQIEAKRHCIVDIELSEKPDHLEFATAAQDNGADSLVNHTRSQAGAWEREESGFVKPDRFVTIMQGCDNFCAYCVVPYVRGREVSRPPENIINEIKMLVKSGVREVTLLGQNVNSYGKKQGLCSFSDLLARINEIEGLLRIRFTTSHPKDLSQELIDAFKHLDKLCKHIHLPVQSGSDNILKKMNRKYTRKLYLEKVDKLRHSYPDIAITSDFIAGFPGETQADADETLSLIRTVEYDSLFAFKYSDRPNAPAAHFSDKVSEEDKKERLEKILKLQEYYTIQKNQALVGKTETVLVEGISKRQAKDKAAQALPYKQDAYATVQWTGRTSTNKVVNFIQVAKNNFRNPDDNVHDEIAPGKMVSVRIKEAFPHSLWGEVCD